MNFQRLSVAITAVAMLASPSLAADNPDMSGTWLIDAKRTDFGGMPPAPPDLVIKIKVIGSEWHVTQSGGGEGPIEMRFNTEGKEVTNDLPRARMTSKHFWEGNILVGEIKITGEEGNTVTFRDRTSLSADGKVQTVERRVSGPAGDGQMKIVLNKQGD